MKNEEAVIAFSEHPIVHCLNEEPTEYDICIKTNEHAQQINGNLCMKYYNEALVRKILLLPKSRLEEFIKYQLQHIKNQPVWLNQLDALLNSILEKVPDRKETIKLLQAITVIGEVKIKCNNKKPKTKLQFDFEEVLMEVSNLSTEAEKLTCLINWKTRFQQNKPVYILPGIVPFDQQIDLEIERIKQIKELTHFETTNNDKIKLQWHGQINVLVDLFYQLSNTCHYRIPLINVPSTTLSEFITQSFLDKEGKELSLETVKTILKPNRMEKRPKSRRIEIGDLLE